VHRRNRTKFYLRRLRESGNDRQVGDVSVDYLFDPRCPTAIAKNFPKVKLIASLRNPTERAISAYYWNLRKGNIQETDLKEGIRQVLTMAETAEQPDLTYEPSRYYVNILARGLYDVQISRYLNHFSREQLLVLPFEKISTDRSQILDRVYEFIGVNSSFRPSALNYRRRPKQNSYRRLLLELEYRLPNTPFYGRIANAAHQLVCQFGLHRDRPSLPEDTSDELCFFYRPHIRYLRQLLRDIPSSRDLWEDISWIYTNQK